jgi:hypothetical protein
MLAVDPDTGYQVAAKVAAITAAKRKDDHAEASPA